jgi:hypothetical protein
MLVETDTCESCGRMRGERHKATTPRPNIEQLQEWVEDAIAEATDGCRIEPDGYCEHGHASWLIVLGFI